MRHQNNFHCVPKLSSQNYQLIYFTATCYTLIKPQESDKMLTAEEVLNFLENYLFEMRIFEVK